MFKVYRIFNEKARVRKRFPKNGQIFLCAQRKIYVTGAAKTAFIRNHNTRKTRFYFTAQAHIHKKAVKFKR